MLTIPTYMQWTSIRPLLRGKTPDDWEELAYHRYWMHWDPDHNAYAHYSIRNQRYKLIYWYNEGFGLPGTEHGGEEKEWELFDCETDPLELVNVYADPAYADIAVFMTSQLDKKMGEIGHTPEH